MVTCLKDNSFQRLSLQLQLNIPKDKVIQTLEDAYEVMGGDPPSKTPFLIWLLENPDSPLPFSGKVDLYRHDCLHILLERSFSLYDEAFIVGFSMGNDPHTKCFEVALFKFISTVFYPKEYRFTQEHLVAFDLGLLYGRKLPKKNIPKFNFPLYKNKMISEIRRELGIDIHALEIMWQAQNFLTEPKGGF